jgi:hypothetical protein
VKIYTVIRRELGAIRPLHATTDETEAEGFYDGAAASDPAASHLLEIVSFDLRVAAVVAVDAFELDDFSEATR